MAVSATHAALRLAQGAGRLVRRADDRGVVAFLDSRMMTARYAGFLQRSLPPFWPDDRQGDGARRARRGSTRWLRRRCRSRSRRCASLTGARRRRRTARSTRGRSPGLRRLAVSPRSGGHARATRGPTSRTRSCGTRPTSGMQLDELVDHFELPEDDRSRRGVDAARTSTLADAAPSSTEQPRPAASARWPRRSAGAVRRAGVGGPGRGDGCAAVTDPGPPVAPAAVLVTGPEELLAERAVAAVLARPARDRARPRGDPPRRPATYQPGELAMHASPSLFGGDKAVVVSDLDEAPDELSDDLLAYLAAARRRRHPRRRPRGRPAGQAGPRRAGQGRRPASSSAPRSRPTATRPTSS